MLGKENFVVIVFGAISCNIVIRMKTVALRSYNCGLFIDIIRMKNIRMKRMNEKYTNGKYRNEKSIRMKSIRTKNVRMRSAQTESIRMKKIYE